MDYINAIILGIIQGLTEFLPVSSSGHLELGKAILGEEAISEDGVMFTIVVHFATALSTIVVFRKDIVEIISGLLQFKWNEQFQFSLKIILSMIPAVFIGLFFEKEIDALFNGDIVFVGFMLILTAILLFFADKSKNTLKQVTFKDAIIVGISQAIAILPGISRSGATISTSVLLGIDKSKAARFSFLMVVPLILGKITKDIMSGDLSSETQGIGILFAGFISAFIAGLFACQWMIKLVRNSQLKYFAIYCFFVGLAAIIVGKFL
jgi:undecaprenyl-diphosphatase